MPNLNNSVMRRMPIFYPPLEEQRALIKAFASLDSKTSTAVNKRTYFKTCSALSFTN